MKTRMARADEFEAQEADGFSFRPLIPAVRFEDWNSAPVTYAVRRNGAGKARQLRVSLHPEVVAEMGVEAGDVMRLDLDRDKGVGRLMCLARECPSGASRRAVILPTGRVNWALPWTGEVAAVFGAPEKGAAALRVVEVLEGEVRFALPAGS